MNNRQRGIFIRLAKAEGPLTSQQLAEALGVSSRTIKADMVSMAPELEKEGIYLISRRNRGYSIQVTDQKRMNKLFNVVNIRTGMSPAADEEGRIIHIARKLVASDRGVLLDELAEQMYLSRGALRLPLQEALRFCHSFRLHRISAPGQGLRVIGEEYQLRLAMTELFGVHFHQAESSPEDEEYAQWIACDWQERQDIRHIFLKILRESPYAVRDSISQRVAMYLILARNRHRAGMYLDLPAEWVREVRELPLFRLAQEIYAALDREIGGYRMGTVETCFLAIMLLTNLDVDLRRDPAVTAPFLATAAEETADSMLERLRAEQGIDLEQIPKARPLLIQTILPMLARARYQMDGMELFNWGIENSYLKLPFEVNCARLMAEELSRRNCRTGHIDLAALSCYVIALLRQVDYPVKPLRLVVTNAIGGDFGFLAAKGIQTRWPHMVEKIIPMELYAVRALKWKEDYDAILLGHLSDEAGSTSEFGYNFEAPMAPLNPNRHGRDYIQVYNQVLVDAYRYDEMIPPDEMYHYWDGFRYYDEEQTLQFLSARYGKDTETARKLFRQLSRQEDQLTMGRQEGMAVIVASPAMCVTPCIDLYRLAKPGKWGENRIQWLLFANYTTKNLAQARAIAVILTNFTKNAQNFEQFAQAPRETFWRLLRESVQYD